MWIAKPLSALTSIELSAWHQIESQLPLSQTLCWGKAIESVAGQAYLILNPEEKVGGMVFSSKDPLSGRDRFECINGPSLHWDNPHSIPRQLATFAVAVSKLSRNFQSLHIKPRWESGLLDKRIPLLPIAPHHYSQAATLIVPLQKSKEELFQNLSARMKRTLRTSWKSTIQSIWQPVTQELLEDFVPNMQTFGEAHHFVVPPLNWFKTLTQNTHSMNPSVTFWLMSSSKFEKDTLASLNQILISIVGNRAYYLYGYEKRMPGLLSKISTSAVGHWEAITQCNQTGISSYDFNGYIINAQPTDPYYGVCRFKEQFSGEITKYDIPEFIIE